jgi:hypothetical protein
MNNWPALRLVRRQDMHDERLEKDDLSSYLPEVERDREI